jgi:hypothetical protein
MLLSAIHKLVDSTWNTEEFLISGKSLLLYLFTKRAIKSTVIIIVEYHSYQLCFDVTDQLLIRLPAFVRYWRKNESTMRQYISYSQTSRKPMIQYGGKFCTIFS